MSEDSVIVAEEEENSPAEGTDSSTVSSKSPLWLSAVELCFIVYLGMINMTL